MMGERLQTSRLAHWRLQALSLAQDLDPHWDQERLQVPYLAHVRLQDLRLPGARRAPSSDGEVLP